MTESARITTHVRADRLSTSTADFLQLVVDTIPALVVSALPDGSVDFINQGWRDYTGLSLESLLGHGWNLVIHPDDVTAFVTEWDRARAVGKPFQNQVRVRRADGEYRWFLIRKAPLRDDSGKIIKWLGTGSDIEDLKQAEARIRQNEAELREIIDAIPAHVLAFQPDGLGIFANRQAVEYTGVSLHDLYIDDWIARVLYPADADRVRSSLPSLLSQNEPFTIEARIKAKTGEYRWFLIRVSPLKDEDGGVVRWYGTRIDIEDLKRTEDALRLSEDSLRESEQSLRLIVDGIAGLVAIMTSEGALQFVNNQVPEYFGKTLEELKGWTTSDAVHRDDLPRVAAAWMESVETGDPYDIDYRLRRADGVYRWFHARGLSLRDAEGRIVRWYVLLTDIDDRKRAEEALKQSEFYLAEGQRLAHVGSWAFDSDGFDYWSPELFRMYGFDPASKAPGIQKYLNCIHPQDRESMASLIERILTEASTFDTTKRIVRPDGEVRYVRCVGVPVIENQRLKKYVGSAIDVTEHELLTQELRRREAYLAEAQRLSHTGSFGWNVSTDEHFWSDETFRIFEFDPSSKVSLQMILECVHPQDMPSVKMARAAATRAEGIDLESRLLMPDGRIKYLHVVGKGERGDTGNIEVIGAVMDITARKLTEVELRRSKAHLTDAQRLSRVGSVGMETSTKRIFWSEESARIYGYAPGTEPTPDLILQRVHPDDVDLLKSVLERAGQGEGDFDFEHRLLMPDGSIKHIYNLSHCYRDEAGNAEVVGAIMDITERKVAEEAIRRSEAYLAEAQRLSHTGSFGWKPDSGEIVWSEETYRIFEYDQAVKPTIDLLVQRVHPEDRPDFLKVTEGASAGATKFEHTYRWLLPDGSVKHVHALAHALQDASGNREFVGAATDITERKIAEEKIREQEMELRQMLDLAPQYVAIFGPDGERIYANRVARDQVGLSLEEWRQAPQGFFRPGRFIHPDDRERAARGYSDSIRSGGSAYELELRILGADGGYRWFLVRFNPVRNEHGQIARWYVAGTDINERKRVEEKLQLENAALREEIDQNSMFEEIVGTSPALRTVLSRISKVAPTDSTVLITGETGTGKELVARAIHKRSQRSGRAFVSVNCAAIPRDLIASELFGHEKGAFTGALQRHLGRFELAEGGTIFLDEIGELPIETQIALLRVLQEKEFDRVGGRQTIRANVRVIAATNRDLDAAVASGTFRSDLYYRLNVFPIAVPPLRERKEDIPMLVEYFVDRYASKMGKKVRASNRTTLDRLIAYPWPGNIRELQNVIERSIILCETEIFAVDESWLSTETVSSPGVKLPLVEKMHSEEKEMIEAALAECKGRVSGPSGAASKLGIPPSTLESKIRSLKIEKRSFF